MSKQDNEIKRGIGALAIALGATVGVNVSAEEYVVIDPNTASVDPVTGQPTLVLAPGTFLKLEMQDAVGRFLKIEGGLRDPERFVDRARFLTPPTDLK